MALWMVRAGKGGEYEDSFLERHVVGLTWGEPLGGDALSHAKTLDEVKSLVAERYPNVSAGTASAWAGMIGKFRLTMKLGDLVIMPRKSSGKGYSVGEIVGPYEYLPNESNANARHIHQVKWLSGTDPIPSAKISPDVLLSLGGLATIYTVVKNDAEARMRAFAQSGFTHFPTLAPNLPSGSVPTSSIDSGEDEELDIEAYASDRLARHLAAVYSGHALATLVEEVLRAQGYTTLKSPPGPDGGMDLLASGGPLGFGAPRILVQVKSGGTPVDLPVYTHMIGAMNKFGADQGLLVSWAGFKKTVQDESRTAFFRVRLWDAERLIAAFLAHYDDLPTEMRASVPLKRVWTLALGEMV